MHAFAVSPLINRGTGGWPVYMLKRCVHWRPCLFAHPCSPQVRSSGVWDQWAVGNLMSTSNCPPGFGDSDRYRCSRGWGSPTFLGLLELSWPCGKDQFGTNSKFSIILRNILFIFLSLRVRGRGQKQEPSRCSSEPPNCTVHFVPTPSTNVPSPTSPLKA